MFPHKDHNWKSGLGMRSTVVCMMKVKWDATPGHLGGHCCIYICICIWSERRRREEGWVYDEGETRGDPGALGANWPIWTHRAPPSRTPLCNHLRPVEQITCRVQSLAIHSNTMRSSNVCIQQSRRTHITLTNITVCALSSQASNHPDDEYKDGRVQ